MTQKNIVLIFLFFIVFFLGMTTEYIVFHDSIATNMNAQNKLLIAHNQMNATLNTSIDWFVCNSTRQNYGR
jgi:hypothetical protein